MQLNKLQNMQLLLSINILLLLQEDQELRLPGQKVG